MTNQEKKVPELRFPEFDGEWEEKTIGKIATTFSGGTPSSTNRSYYNGEIPFIRSGEISKSSTELMINKEAISNSSAKMVEKGDLLYALYGATSGEVAISKINGAINQAVLCIRSQESATYIFNYLKMKKYQILKTYIQGGQGNLSASIIKKVDINLPYIEEQEKIGTFFSKLDRQIELEEQKLEKLEEQKKGYMQKIFSQELRFKDENGNEYPEWEEKTIKDVYKVTRGYVLARKLMSDNPNSINKYPVYSSQTSNNGLMGYYSDYLYQDAITWTTDGANAGSVSFRQGKFYCTNVCGVLLNELGNSNVCMAEMLNNIAFKYVSKVGNPKLMNNVMAMIKLKFPCLEEQQAISKFLNVFSEVIDNQNKKVELLKERKKGFLQKMFV